MNNTFRDYRDPRDWRLWKQPAGYRHGCRACGCESSEGCPCTDTEWDFLKVNLEGFTNGSCDLCAANTNGRVIWLRRVSGCIWILCNDHFGYACLPEDIVDSAFLVYDGSEVTFFLGGYGVSYRTSGWGAGGDCTATLTLVTEQPEGVNCIAPDTLALDVNIEMCEAPPTCCDDDPPPETLSMEFTVGGGCSTTYTISLAFNGFNWTGSLTIDGCTASFSLICISGTWYLFVGTPIGGGSDFLSFLVQDTLTCSPFSLSLQSVHNGAGFPVTPFTCCHDPDLPDTTNVLLTATVTE